MGEVDNRLLITDDQYRRPYMSSLKEQYVEEGYVVVKDVLNIEQDIYPLQKA